MSNEVAKTQTRALAEQKAHGTLRGFLDRSGVKAALSAALPKHMTAERMVRVALTAVAKTPKLLSCTPESVYECLLTSSQLGLEPNGRDAYLIPFGNKCTLIPGYMGLIQLAYRSGQIDSFSAKAVYEKDHFVFRYGLDETLEHTPCTEDNPGELVYAWAMVHFKNGGHCWVVLNRRDINKRMASSKTASRSDSPWKTHPEPMWAKSAVRELAKWIPQTPEMQNFHDAVTHDNEIEDVTSRSAAEPEMDIIDTVAALPNAEATFRATEPPYKATPFDPQTDANYTDTRMNAAPQTEESPAGPDPMASEAHRREYGDIIASIKTPGGCDGMEKQAEVDETLTEADRAKVIEACRDRAETIKINKGKGGGTLPGMQ